MSSREIVLWLDERWYDALERHIKGESLQDKLEDYLDELCNNLLPDYEYEQYVSERMENTGRVVGAFDIDFDAGTFDALNVTDGWHRFAVRDVRTAAYRADRKSNESPDDRLAKLLEYLHDRELTQPAPSMEMGQTMC